MATFPLSFTPIYLNVILYYLVWCFHVCSPTHMCKQNFSLPSLLHLCSCVQSPQGFLKYNTIIFYYKAFPPSSFPCLSHSKIIVRFPSLCTLTLLFVSLRFSSCLKSYKSGENKSRAQLPYVTIKSLLLNGANSFSMRRSHFSEI